MLAGQWPVAPFLHQLSFSPDTGIECPRGARNLPGSVQEGEPFSEEATLFTKELVLQREVGHLPAASCTRQGEKNDVFLPCQRSVCRSVRCSAFHIHAPSRVCPHLISLSLESLASRPQIALHIGVLGCAVTAGPAEPDPDAASSQLCVPA